MQALTRNFSPPVVVYRHSLSPQNLMHTLTGCVTTGRRFDSSLHPSFARWGSAVFFFGGKG